MQILNLTQHNATPDQLAAGVVDLPAKQAQLLRQLLTFDSLPTAGEIVARAERIAGLAEQWEVLEARWVSAASGYPALPCDPDAVPDDVAFMLGGAPWLMPHLERAFAQKGLRVCYAFSARASEEQTLPDGTVRKVQIFRHQGFVWVD